MSGTDIGDAAKRYNLSLIVDTGTGIYLPTRALCDAPILTWRMVLPAYGELTAWVSVFTEVADRAMRTLRDAVAHVGMLLPGIFS